MTIWICLLAALAVVGDSTDRTILYFSSKGCPACHRMRPAVEQLHSKGWVIRFVDTELERETAQRWRVREIPALVVLEGGREVDRIVGSLPADELQRRLNRNSTLNPPRPEAVSARQIESRSIAPSPNALLGPNHPLNRRSNAPLEQFQTKVESYAKEDTHPNIGVNHPFYSRYLQRKTNTRGTISGPDSQPIRLGLRPSGYVHPLLKHAKKLPNLPASLAATVRIRVKYSDSESVGTGTIIETSGEQALVLTCGHLFHDGDRTHPVSVELFQNGNVVTAAAEVVDFRNNKIDLGLVMIRHAGNVTKAALLPKGEQLEVLDSVFSIGCDRGADPSRRDTVIAKLNRFLGPDNIEIAGAPVQGRSGGGLFDAQGRLIGVCFAADTDLDEGLYVGPQAIYELLAEHRLNRLFEPTSLKPSE